MDLPISMCRSYLNQPPPAPTLYPDWDDNCNSWLGIRWAAPAPPSTEGHSKPKPGPAPVTSSDLPPSPPRIRFPDPACWATPSLLHIIVLIAISTWWGLEFPHGFWAGRDQWDINGTYQHMWVQKGRQFYALIRRGEGQSQREYIRSSTGSSQHPVCSRLMTQSEQTQGQMEPYTAHVVTRKYISQWYLCVHDKRHMGQLSIYLSII